MGEMLEEILDIVPKLWREGLDAREGENESIEESLQYGRRGGMRLIGVEWWAIAVDSFGKVKWHDFLVVNLVMHQQVKESCQPLWRKRGWSRH